MQDSSMVREQADFVLVPVILSEYLAVRTADPDRILQLLVAAIGGGLTEIILPDADVHAGLTACPWKALTMTAMVGNCVKVDIVATDWTISADDNTTVLTYRKIFQIVEGTVGLPLKSVFEAAILPPELIIKSVEVSATGEGVFSCSGFTRPLGSRPNRHLSALVMSADT
ncbi:hypothetical protein ABIB28_003317 [Sphingomonas sp. UYEF23]